MDMIQPKLDRLNAAHTNQPCKGLYLWTVPLSWEHVL